MVSMDLENAYDLVVSEMCEIKECTGKVQVSHAKHTANCRWF